jgi:glutamyl-tRNA reductase
MAILVYGMNHTTAPLAVRERAAFLVEEMPGAVERLLEVEGVREALILTTCNRTDLVVSAGHAAIGPALRGFLERERRLTADDLDRHCYLHEGAAAVRHVFRTAASLDSMVLGEAQILGQVKDAYAAAAGAAALGTILESLLQHAFAVAKKVRSRTGIARQPVSVAQVAARLARDIFGDLEGRGVLLIGAGEMARLAARHLAGADVGAILVINRSLERAESLAAELGGRALPFDRLFEAMEGTDIVITSTAAPGHVIRLEDAQRLTRSRRGRPLFLIDIAVPRDVDPAVNRLDDVYLYDLDDLQKIADRNLDSRARESSAAEAIVEHETAEYLARLHTLEVAPTIVELRRRLRDLGEEEMRRWRGQLGALSEEQWAALHEMVVSLINKFLHPPTVALKQAARAGTETLRLRLLREIFALGAAAPPADEAVAADAPAGVGGRGPAGGPPGSRVRPGRNARRAPAGAGAPDRARGGPMRGR